MNESEQSSTDVGRPLVAVFVVGIALTVGAAVAGAASYDTHSLWGVGIPWIAFAIAFGVQWVAFVPAYLRQTEHFYDLTGSVTYLTLVGLALAFGGQDARSLLLATVISVWAVRLGVFLFRRVLQAGSDSRFDEIKISAPRFLVAWTLQGAWVFLTLSAAIAAMAASNPAPIGVVDALGALIWGLGFAVEVVADRQKSAFRRESTDGFIDSGLWSFSRHPNYLGEIVLWVGVAIIAASTLRGWQWVTMISPVFVVILLTRVSGIPLLEERADARWGDDPSYQAYKARTPVLVPRLWSVRR